MLADPRRLVFHRRPRLVTLQKFACIKRPPEARDGLIRFLELQILKAGQPVQAHEPYNPLEVHAPQSVLDGLQPSFNRDRSRVVAVRGTLAIVIGRPPVANLPVCLAHESCERIRPIVVVLELLRVLSSSAYALSAPATSFWRTRYSA
jgi:hypothetical protein